MPWQAAAGPQPLLYRLADAELRPPRLEVVVDHRARGRWRPAGITCGQALARRGLGPEWRSLGLLGRQSLPCPGAADLRHPCKVALEARNSVG